MRDIYYIIYIIGTKKLKISRVKKIRLIAYSMYFFSHLGGYFEQTRLKTE